VTAPRITTDKRLTYAEGYLALGMAEPALEEVEAIEPGERQALPVLKVTVECLMAAKRWERVVETAPPIVESEPHYEPAWIAWAFALRELERVEEAREVLLAALPHHEETSGLVHYNLACYESLLGNPREARRRLARASALDPHWREAAREDPDLRRMFERYPHGG
jgi:tetratricopeptide (TPR) repeat protein